MKRLLLICTTLVVICGSALAEQEKIKIINYLKVETSMSFDAVRDLMGPPTRVSKENPSGKAGQDLYLWDAADQKNTYSMTFEDGKLKSKAIATSTDLVTDQFIAYATSPIGPSASPDSAPSQNNSRPEFQPAPNTPPIPPAPEKAAPIVTESPQWLPDLTNVSIPDIPAQGRINGQPFHCDRATLSSDILELRQGKDFFEDLGVTLFLFKKGQEAENRTFSIPTREARVFGDPHVHMKWKENAKDLPKAEIYMDEYVLRLELGSKSNGKIPGRIYLCLPDAKQSFIAGNFEASLKEGGKTIPANKNSSLKTKTLAAVIIGMFASFLLLPILSVVFFIFWIWLLIDCVTWSFPGQNEKLIWILILIFVPVIGPIVYYFVVKRKRG
jgi:hypothetical protein